MGYTQLVQARAELLVPLLFIAFLAGEWLAHYSRLEAILTRLRNAVATFGRKLDRQKRSAATLVYRGIIATMLVVVPAMALGVLLSLHHPASELFTLFFLLAWFGRNFATHAGWRLWRRATADTTPLELPGLDYLFPDSHAVLRYSIAKRSEQFQIGIIGTAFWYVALDLPAAFAYLALATASDTYRSAAFGWAARSLFTLLNFPPQCIGRLLFTLAALFTPHTRPAAIFKGGDWKTFTAHILGGALGGPGPEGNTPWAGVGTARLTHQHLRSFLLLTSVASLLCLLLLASPTIYKLLIKLI